MTGESGYVASEGFPNLYPPNKECIWTITVRRPFGPSSLLQVSEAWVQAAKGQTAKGIPSQPSPTISPRGSPSPLPSGQCPQYHVASDLTP